MFQISSSRSINTCLKKSIGKSLKHPYLFAKITISFVFRMTSNLTLPSSIFQILEKTMYCVNTKIVKYYIAKCILCSISVKIGLILCFRRLDGNDLLPSLSLLWTKVIKVCPQNQHFFLLLRFNNCFSDSPDKIVFFA